MRRLLLGTVVPGSLLLVVACSGDPTENLRSGIAQLNPSPSQLFIEQGKTTSVDVTATDEQGNVIQTAFVVAPTDIGQGIGVVRDLAFRNVFVNDSTSAPPDIDTQFRFRVTGNDLVSTAFKIRAGDDSVVVPVRVTPAPGTIPLATVASTGPNASDTTVLTLPAPYIFGAGAAVTFDAGGAIVLSTSADGRSMSIFPPPGATSAATITGIGLDYLPELGDSTFSNVPLTIGTTVPPQPGTDDPATAPTIALPASGSSVAFYDGAAFGSPVCGQANDGVPCQLYKISLPADGSFDATLGWSNTTDLGLYVLSADGTTDTDQACDALGNGDDGGEEACTITLPAGDYLIAVVNFGPFYTPPDPAPDWISLKIAVP
jgi:pre-peptidase